MTETQRMNAVDRFCDGLREKLLKLVRTPDKTPRRAPSQTLRKVAELVALWHARHEREWADKHQHLAKLEPDGKLYIYDGPTFTVGRIWARNYLWEKHSIRA